MGKRRERGDWCGREREVAAPLSTAKGARGRGGEVDGGPRDHGERRESEGRGPRAGAGWGGRVEEPPKYTEERLCYAMLCCTVLC